MPFWQWLEREGLLYAEHTESRRYGIKHRQHERCSHLNSEQKSAVVRQWWALTQSKGTTPGPSHPLFNPDFNPSKSNSHELSHILGNDKEGACGLVSLLLCAYIPLHSYRQVMHGFKQKTSKPFNMYPSHMPGHAKQAAPLRSHPSQ